MARFEYKDGCLRCNQCGRLYEPDRPDDAGYDRCPCGNGELLDALDGLVELYNGQPGGSVDLPDPPAQPESDS